MGISNVIADSRYPIATLIHPSSSSGIFRREEEKEMHLHSHSQGIWLDSSQIQTLSMGGGCGIRPS
jgi:hypothetical protein